MFKVTLLCVTAILLSNTAWSQSVIPDFNPDTGETSVTFDEDGRALVDIVSADQDGISHNRFTRFNVTEAGLDFDNRFAGARTIISEVTGGERSLIKGDIEILGQRAHLFLANPNGISINGSRFINTGGLVLSTGDLDFIERVPAPFRTQNNITLDVNKGEIIVGPDGLSGAMDTLHFLSKSLRIDGEVANENTSAFAGIEMTIGDSQSEFDSSLLPQNDLSTWADVEAGEAESEDAFLIDITETGGLQGSQVTALVTDVGAGVRHAGNVLADRRDFTITTDGRIEINGGVSTSSQGIIFSGREIVATGDITEAVEDEAIRSIPQINIPGEFEPNFTPEPLPEPEDMRAQMVAVNGPVTLTASTGIDIGQSFMSAAGDISLEANEDILWNSSEAVTGGQFSLNSESVHIMSDDARSFLASLGPLSILARSGDIVAEGARLQGGVGLQDDADDSEGGNSEDGETLAAVSLSSPTGVFLSSLDEDNLAVIFGVDGDVHITSGGDILNHTGRIIANGDVSIQAAGDFNNIIAVPDGDATPIITTTDQGRTRRLGVSYGDLDIPNQLAFVTASGSIDVSAGQTIRNIGGQLNANDGEITLAAHNVFTESVVAGEFTYKRRCFILCNSSGTSTINVFGGQISANGAITINAENSFINRGGVLTGLGGVEINSSDVVLEALYLPQLVDRRSGLYNFWTGHSAWVYWRDVQGQVFAGDGKFVINGANRILVRGIEIDNIISDFDITHEYGPRQSHTAYEQSLGLIAELAPIVGN